MSATIDQRIDDLLKHTGVWDETKDTLRDLLAEHKAGTLDAEDARYIEGLHKKMFPGRNAAPMSDAKPSPSRPRDIAAVKPANDDAQLASARRGLSGADLIQRCAPTSPTSSCRRIWPSARRPSRTCGPRYSRRSRRRSTTSPPTRKADHPCPPPRGSRPASIVALPR